VAAAKMAKAIFVDERLLALLLWKYALHPQRRRLNLRQMSRCCIAALIDIHSSALLARLGFQSVVR
jgi:hypothetical protein